MSVNFQYSNASCVSYPSSTKTLIWAVVNPRVPCSVPVNALVVTGVENCTGFILACEAPAPCSTVESFCASVGGFWSSADENSPGADITYKINTHKQS